MREEVELLEDHADVAAQLERPAALARSRRQARPVLDAEHAHRALGRLLEQVDRAQQRRLARAGRAEDDDVLAGVDGQVDAVQHLRSSRTTSGSRAARRRAPCSALGRRFGGRQSGLGGLSGQKRSHGGRNVRIVNLSPTRCQANGCLTRASRRRRRGRGPVTYEAASEDRNATAAAISSGRPSRPSGTRSRPSAASSALEARPSVRSVSTVPGATALTRTPLPADLARSRLREQPDGALGRVVDRHRPGRGGEARRRADRDDAAPSARRHRPNGRLDDEEDTADVHVHQPVVVGRLDLDERSREERRRHSRRRLPAASPRRPRRPPRAPASTSVTSEHDERAVRPSARELRDALGGRGFVDVGHDDVVPTLGEGARDRAADPLRAADDERAACRVSGCCWHR